MIRAVNGESHVMMLMSSSSLILRLMMMIVNIHFFFAGCSSFGVIGVFLLRLKLILLELVFQNLRSSLLLRQRGFIFLLEVGSPEVFYFVIGSPRQVSCNG